MQTVIWLDELGRDLLEIAGGKGANLGEMIRAGLPVPPGFVITTAAYRAWSGREALPPEAVAAITRAYAALAERMGVAGGELAVAVRSSATAEDLPDASFAGQQETYLNIRGAAALLGAVRQCWASLSAPRAVAYREQMGYGHSSVSLAVVVQGMVEAETAGVLFTANPMTGSRTEMVVNASYGLGESVVSGSVTPDTFILSASGEVKSRTRGAKEHAVRPAGEGTVTEPVNPQDRARFCLEPAQLVELAQMGRRVAGYYGAPQDIEWAYAKGHLYLLQARPITALGQEQARQAPAKGAQELDAFYTSNLKDHYPVPPKPLDLSVIRTGYGAMIAMFRAFGLAAPDPESLLEPQPDGAVRFRVPVPRPGPLALVKGPAMVLRALRSDPLSTWEGIRPGVESALAELRQRDLPAKTASALLERLEGIDRLVREYLPRRFVGVFPPGMLHEARLKFLVRRAVGAARLETTLRQLMGALPYRTARMNRDTARLAEVAATAGRESPAFAGALERFLQVWGNSPSVGMEPLPSFPTWAEDPSAVLGLVEALQHDAEARDSDRLDRLQTAQFEAARAEVVGRLGAIPRRWFERSLEVTRRFLLAREDGLYMVEQVGAELRRTALALGARLAEEGQLARPDDIFYLLLPELGDLVRGEKPLQELVATRRQAYGRLWAAHERGVHWLEASGSVRAAAGERPAGAGLAGIPASPGQATGRVCVVRGPAEFGKLRRGDILVAPLTAPAWTPLFSLAAAVVTDVGGPLSHAAIVAREYGIPAVLGIPGATGALQDGQQVTVDGSRGLVTPA